MEEFFLYLIIAVTLSEFIISAFWAGAYFRFGVPVYRRTINIKKLRTGLADELERNQRPGAARPFIFRAISLKEIAFREKMYGLYWLDYLPVMRGLIHVDKNGRNVQLTGIINWYALLLPVFMFLLIRSSNELIFVAAIMALLFVIYLFQRHRFDKICELLELRA